MIAQNNLARDTQYHEESSMSNPGNPDVTIVVCTFNRADSLKEALESLIELQTDGFSYEVLVVNNASTDHTPDVVQEVATAASCTVRSVKEPQAGVSFARNCGVKNALGEWIAFFDDDQLAEADWLVNLFNSAKEQDVQAVGGAVHLLLVGGDSHKRNLRPWIRVLFGCSDYMGSGYIYNRKNTPGTGNLLMHKDVFDQVGFFRTDLVEGGEDTELYHRMRRTGRRVFFCPTAIVHHQVPGFRLEPQYIKLASMRMGNHIARREFNDFSRLTFPLMIFARSVQAVGLYGGRLLLARLKGDKEEILERQSKWWLGQGYLRAAVRFLFFKEKAVSTLEFRSERKPASSA